MSCSLGSVGQGFKEAQATQLRAILGKLKRKRPPLVYGGDLVAQLEEADRKAEIARREWEAAEERRRREEDQRRIQQSVKESRDHLGQVIQQWAEIKSIEQFLRGVEDHAASLSDAERQQVLDRLTLARHFLGSQNPLEFFMSWKTPTERYQPLYRHNED